MSFVLAINQFCIDALGLQISLRIRYQYVILHEGSYLSHLSLEIVDSQKSHGIELRIKCRSCTVLLIRMNGTAVPVSDRRQW
jgi:hypothetical protein